MSKYLLYCVIILGYLSRVQSKLDYEKETKIYNDIRLKFPPDPCEEVNLDMPDFTAPGRRVSEVKCLEYTWQMRNNQIKSLRVDLCELSKVPWDGLIGGGNAFVGEYPHMGALGWKAKVGGWTFKCGGTLISEKFVVTAAHCSQVRKIDQTVADVHPKIVRLGSRNILDNNPDGEQAYDVGILKFIPHNRYKAPRQYYDIALVELEKEVPFQFRVHPACLWTKFENPERGIVTGWGVVDSNTREVSPVLQKAPITLRDYDECEAKLEVKRNRNWQGFLRHQLCAGEKAGGIDTCQGDSGGPLQKLIPLNREPGWRYYYLYHVIGVTSFGFGCAQPDTPSVYTRIASFLGWIENIVWPNNSTMEDNRFFL
ncbi:unnamed protein product, partial [Brenthis ino]